MWDFELTCIVSEEKLVDFFLLFKQTVKLSIIISLNTVFQIIRDMWLNNQHLWIYILMSTSEISSV